MNQVIIIGMAAVYLRNGHSERPLQRREMERVEKIEIRLNKLHEELGGSNDRMIIVEEMDRLENEKALLCKAEKRGVE